MMTWLRPYSRTDWALLLSASACIAVAILLASCKSAPQIRTQVIDDLNMIVQQNTDCPQLCDALKAYVSHQVGN